MRTFLITLVVYTVLAILDEKFRFTKRLSRLLTKAQYYSLEIASFLAAIILSNTLKRYGLISEVLFACAIAILGTLSVYKKQSPIKNSPDKEQTLIKNKRQ